MKRSSTLASLPPFPSFLWSLALVLSMAVGTLLLAWVASHAAHAEDARVLPQGRGRFSVTYAQTASISTTFNDQGRAESLTAPYQLELNSSRFQGIDSDFGKLVRYLNGLNLHYNPDQLNNGYYGLTQNDSDPLLGDALSRGFLNVDAHATRKQYVASCMFGVTDRLTVGLVVPYIQSRVHVSQSLGGKNTADDIYRGFLGAGARPSGAMLEPAARTGPATASAAAPGGDTGFLEQVEKNLDFLRSLNIASGQDLLASKGYARFADSEQNGLGDVVLGARFNTVGTRELIASVQAGVTAPTGSLRPPSEITQIDLGQGSWDIGLAHLLNYSPWRFLTLSNGLHYTRRFWASRQMRVKKNDAELIPDASDEENLAMRLGDKAWATLGARFQLSALLSLELSYEWARKFKDRFEGHRSDRDYRTLSNGTDTASQTLGIGASFDLLPSFLDHAFPLPAQLALNVFLPQAGKNTPVAPYGTAELAIYF